MVLNTFNLWLYASVTPLKHVCVSLVTREASLYILV